MVLAMDKDKTFRISTNNETVIRSLVSINNETAPIIAIDINFKEEIVRVTMPTVKIKEISMVMSMVRMEIRLF